MAYRQNKTGQTCSFTYNDEGIRTSKTKNGETTYYFLNGSQIIGEKTGNDTTLYVYDEAGRPIGIQYRSASYGVDQWDLYFFEKNLQGDIVAVYNHEGTKLVSYVYDAWGNITVSYHNGGENTSVNINPFRYRGYYYDADLGLYYLNSRYYDSNTGRFISADGYVSTGQGLIGSNMYAYCNNNPIMYVDPTGEFLEFLTMVVGDILMTATSGIISPTVAGMFASAVGVRTANTVTSIIFPNEDITEGLQESYTKEEATEAINSILLTYAKSDTEKAYISFWTDESIQIRNSYLVDSYVDRTRICTIIERTVSTKQTAENMSAEWLGHNVSFAVTHTERTQHVDFELGGIQDSWIRYCTDFLDFLGVR